MHVPKDDAFRAPTKATIGRCRTDGTPIMPQHYWCVVYVGQGAWEIGFTLEHKLRFGGAGSFEFSVHDANWTHLIIGNTCVACYMGECVKRSGGIPPCSASNLAYVTGPTRRERSRRR